MTSPKKKWSLGKKIGVGVLSFFGVLVLVIGLLVVIKPWAPEIVVADAGPTGRRVADNGMIANYYPAPGPGRHPTVVVVGGSDGGIGRQVDRTAQALQKEGYTALALSYWGAEGQPEIMDRIPLETFRTAFAWVLAQPEVDPERFAFMGTSKGGEAAVLLASQTPEFKAVVGYVPSHVVWAGFNLREPWKWNQTGSTWSAGGQDVAYVPYIEDFRGGPMVDMYVRSWHENLPQHQDAIIPIENSRAPLLLICGEQDTLWPSCDMSREVEKRAAEHSGPNVTVLAYPEAGHMISGPPADPDHPFDATQMGGTKEGSDYALSDSWPKVLEFLRAELA